MKNILSSLNEFEKKRILEMHYNATNRQYLAENPTGTTKTTTGATTKQGGTEKTQTAPAKTQAKERVTGLDKINQSVTALNKWSTNNPIRVNYDPAGVYVPNLKLLTKSIKENRNASKFKTEFTYPYGLTLTLTRSNGGSTTDTQYMTLKKADCFKTYKFDWDSGIGQGGYKTINDGITNLYNGFYKGNQETTFCGIKDQYFSNTNGVSAPTQEIQNLSYNIFDARLYSEPLDSWNFL